MSASGAGGGGGGTFFAFFTLAAAFLRVALGRCVRRWMASTMYWRRLGESPSVAATLLREGVTLRCEGDLLLARLGPGDLEGR